MAINTGKFRIRDIDMMKSCPSGRQTVAGDQFHLIAKTIQLVERGVNVGCNPNTLKFLVHDRHGENVMFVEQILHYGLGVCAFDVNVRDGAHLVTLR